MENINLTPGTKVTIERKIDIEGQDKITVTQTQDKPLLDKAGDKLNEIKDYLGAKITDAKDATYDFTEKAKVEAQHAAIDAQYNMNKAAVETAKFIEKKADDLKEGANQFKKDVQKEGLF